MFTVWVLKLHHCCPHERPVPTWLRCVIRRRLSDPAVLDYPSACCKDAGNPSSVHYRQFMDGGQELLRLEWKSSYGSSKRFRRRQRNRTWMTGSRPHQPWTAQLTATGGATPHPLVPTAVTRMSTTTTAVRHCLPRSPGSRAWLQDVWQPWKRW